MSRRKKPELVVPRASAEELQRRLGLHSSGAAGTHGQGERRARNRNAARRAAIRFATQQN